MDISQFEASILIEEFNIFYNPSKLYDYMFKADYERKD